MSENVHTTKSMPLPHEINVQLSEISSSTKSDIVDVKKPNDSCKLADAFENIECKRMAKIFGNPCWKFLNGECQDEKCIHEHKLPDPKVLRKHLNALSIDGVRFALNSLVRLFDVLLDRYFCTFTEYFSENHHKADLIEMISICKHSSMHLQSNCVHVIDALVHVGMNYSHALILVFNCHKDLTEKSMFVLTALITDKRNDNVTYFLSDLISFYDEKKFRFNAIIIDRLMQICMDMPYNDKWYSFVRKVVNDWPSIGDLNLDLVYDFCSMTPRRSAIIRKYLSNLH